MKLKVFTQKGCPYCKELMDYLKKQNIDFDEIKTTKDDKEIYAIPTICLEDKCVIGFNREKIRKLLEEKK